MTEREEAARLHKIHCSGCSEYGGHSTVKSERSTACECPGVKAGYLFAHTPDCPRREARPFA